MRIKLFSFIFDVDRSFYLVPHWKISIHIDHTRNKVQFMKILYKKTMSNELNLTNVTFYIYINNTFEEMSYKSLDSRNEDDPILDYFVELLFSADFLSIFTVLTFLTGMLVIIPGFIGIIWYEKYGNHRNR